MNNYPEANESTGGRIGEARGLAILAFGVVPCLYFVPYVLQLLAFALATLWIPLALWPLAAIWGVVSLIRAAFGDVTFSIFVGLLGGVIAIAPIIFWAASDREIAILIAAVSPAVVAVALMTTVKRPDDPAFGANGSPSESLLDVAIDNGSADRISPDVGGGPEAIEEPIDGQ